MPWALLGYAGVALALLLPAAWLLRPRKKKAARRPVVTHVLPCPPGNHGKRIGILIVAYNALTTLSDVLKRIPKDVWDNIEEVAVFDDHSKDQTYELGLGVKTLHRLEKLTILRNEKNLGYGGNQKRGYRYFQEKGFDVVVMLHGDGQYAPEVLAHLYAPIAAGQADAVFGSRMMKDYGGPIKGGMPLYKYVGNKILTTYANVFLGMRMTEFHSGYRAYNLHAVKELNFDEMTNDFHFDTQIIIKLHHQGFRIKEVPIPTYYGDEICHVNGMKYARDVYHAVKRYKATVNGREVYPEYAEFAAHYPLKESRYSSHYHFERIAGRDNEVLDIGCGEGYFAERIARNGNRVHGIDCIASASRGEALTGFTSADLDGGLGDALPKLNGRRFDVVLLQDILEHLRSPERMLRDCHEVLRPHGRIAVSVPNVANIVVRLSLLLGRFEYTPRGILDRTHLRFFTRKTIRRLLEQEGYEVLQQKSSVMPLELAFGVSPHNPVMKAINRTLAVCTWIWPSLLGYQSILVARPRPAGKAAAPARPAARAA